MPTNILHHRLLQATIAQNSRVRQLLNRIAGGVREFDAVQSNFTRSLGIPYKRLPQELFDAFSHDPAAVTGATRRFRGWQAVDDIHNRLARQHEIFQGFLQQEADFGVFRTPDGILTDPINSLLVSLESLDCLRREITVKAKEVSDVLNTVQGLHAKVKSEYNDALSHTSLVYPEASLLVFYWCQCSPLSL